MRLLFRSNAHRSVDGVLEIASSPDTQRREPWQWHLRTAHLEAHDADPDTICTVLEHSDGLACQLALTMDRSKVSAEMCPLDVAAPATVQRTADELVILVVARGTALLGGVYSLDELDTMVLAGDDPLETCIEQASTEPVNVVVVRLRSVDDGGVAWVP